MNWEDRIGADKLTQQRLQSQQAAKLNEQWRKDAAAETETATPVQEGAFEADTAFELARTSLDFLAALAMPTVFKFLFPPVFQSVWQWLLSFVNQTRVFPRLVLGLPRGFGKTTLVKIFILYCILFTKKSFILITGSTGPLAENILADIMSYLSESNIKRIFGDWEVGKVRDAHNIKRFAFRNKDMVLVAMGAGGSLRGMNLGDRRPDVMLFDDIQTRECADSAVESATLERWMFGTAMKAKDPSGCLYIFIGNMYPTKYSILRKLKKNPKWVKFIAGGILADGTSLWEELQPIEQLLEEYESDLAAGHGEIFHAEVLNDENAAANNFVKLSELPPPPYNPGDVPAGKFIVIDPSNDKANSDAVSIGYFEIHDVKPCLRKCIDDRLSPGNTIKEALSLALQTGTRAIFIEANAYQYSLLYWFTFFVERLGIIGLHCLPVYSGSLSKNTRILNFFKAYSKGEIFVEDSCKDQVHTQILQFNALKRDNTDGLLDLMTYAPRIIEEQGAFISSLNVIEQQDESSTEVWGELENSCF